MVVDVVSGGRVVEVVVGSPTVGVGGLELVGTAARVVGALVVAGSSGGVVSSGSVGGVAGMNRRRVVVGASVVSGASVVEVVATVVGPPLRLNGGREVVVVVSDGSGRGTVTGARLAASVRTSVSAC
jgi:hypothetical protein